MAKEILFEHECRADLLAGCGLLAASVGCTLGPKGNNVCLERGETVQITKDGVLVAKEVFLENPVANQANLVLREAANKTNENVGDGTTSSIILANAIYTEGIKLVAAGYNPILLQRGMLQARDIIIEEMEQITKPLNDKTDLLKIAKIAANGDSGIANIIVEAIDKVGRSGVIAVEDGIQHGLNLDITDGFELDKGFASPLFVTEIEKNTCELNDPLILVTDMVISSNNDIVPIMNECFKLGKPLVVFAEKMENDAWVTFLTNINKKVMRGCLINPPMFGDKRKDALEDIAIAVGAKFITKTKCHTLKDITTDDLGTAKIIRVYNNKTQIIEGGGSEEALLERIKLLEVMMEQSGSEYDQDKFKQRIGQLTGGVAVIKINTPSELELKELKTRIEDTLSATRAAFDGIVAGGGFAFTYLSNKLKKDIKQIEAANEINTIFYNDTQFLGAKCVINCLKCLTLTLFNNADLQLIETNTTDPFYVYDFRSDTWGDAWELGVIDPVTVLQNVLNNAVSAASTLLTVGCVITNK